MKNYMKYLVSCSVVIAAMFLTGCDKDKPEDGGNGPSITWTNTAGTTTYDFSKRYDSSEVEVLIKAVTESAFTKFTVDIDSNLLTAEVLGLAGLTTKLDLINPSVAEAAALQNLGFPTGTGITSKKSVSIDITNLLPMISMLGQAGTCDFKLTATDASGTTVKTVKLDVAAPAVQ